MAFNRWTGYPLYVKNPIAGKTGTTKSIRWLVYEWFLI
jgi:hypothetical protein